jgi:4-hydroxy-3-methylbut-2-enyl diphosphate reductase
MVVIRADCLGLCPGVRRALRLAEQAIDENPGVPLYSYGPLIHNRRVVDDLRERGLVPVEDLSHVREGIVVIRSHGIGPAERKECERPGIRCIDATCPTVRRIQEDVRAYSARGFDVLIVGDPRHGEVRGIAGYARRSAVVPSPAEAETVPLVGLAFLVAQSTFDEGEFRQIRDILLRRKPDIVVEDTLCHEIAAREAGIRRLAASVDALLVIGGRRSANTGRLHRAALASGQPSWRVEGAGDLPHGMGNFATVGISAGASTPDFIIDEVEAALRALVPKDR